MSPLDQHRMRAASIESYVGLGALDSSMVWFGFDDAEWELRRVLARNYDQFHGNLTPVRVAYGTGVAAHRHSRLLRKARVA